ncbi:MAG: phosphodiester glycosidase family protein [Pyrinomonadaceae bacterium]|nr:phosphodiester glycosidase family protein [Pyrinomonadaceae bacterium]
MNNPFARYRFLVFSFCVLCVLCGSTNAQDWKTLGDGIEYAEVTKEISGKSVNMNLLRLDLKKVRLDVHHAMDAAIGTEKTSSIATRHGAYAAINAGFFRFDNSTFAGDAAGLMVIDGHLVSESISNRIALQMINRKKATEISIGRFDINAWLGSFDSRFQVKLSGINRERKANEIVLYSSFFGPSTLSSISGTDIVLSNCKQKKYYKNAKQTVCENVEIRHDSGNTEIPRDGFVISTGTKDFKERTLLLNEIKIYELENKKRKSVYIRAENALTSSSTIAADEDMIAGVPQLIKNGIIDITWEQEKTTKAFVETRHPRTAVAKLKDGKFLMITVDGRSEASGGIGLQDLAEYLLSLGAIDAMNLDGGGSTTMFVSGKVVNQPSDKEGERKVSDAILVTPRVRK